MYSWIIGAVLWFLSKIIYKGFRVTATIHKNLKPLPADNTSIAFSLSKNEICYFNKTPSKLYALER